VTKVEDVFPEMEKRNRKWMTYQEAVKALENRPELLDALERSSIFKS